MRKGMLHHIEINVSNLKASEAFWGWLLTELGYVAYQRWEQGVSWRLGNTYLVFVQTQEKHLNVPYHRSRVGLNHLAFFTDSRSAVDALTEQLREKKVAILYPEKHPYAGGPDHYAVYFEDPDRIKVEIVADE
ncbi:VOC family protein [Camelliibacillus cellulosilyticus]|uniref:VOC family protein n=1 Tax=Camelliibacillus cellulosilyticus TaxID=2174486 RepID=A0ABV9GPF1_9BACL